MNFCPHCGSEMDISLNLKNKITLENRMKYGRYKGHYKWDLAVLWLQMSNDTFFEIYGFNFVPNYELLNKAKEYVDKFGSENVIKNINIEIDGEKNDDILANIGESIRKNSFKLGY